MNKYWFVLLFGIGSILGIYSQDFYGQLPDGFEKVYVYEDDTKPWHITGSTKSGLVDIYVYEDTREIALSQNEKYLFITSGTDVVGGIEFYDIKARKYVYGSAYAGVEPEWKSNRVSFEGVELIGEGYTIRRLMAFDNGNVISGKQYVGIYHGSGEELVDPLCDNYKLEKYGNIAAVVQYLIDRTKRIESKFPELYNKMVTSIDAKDISKKAIFELFDQSEYVITQLLKSDDGYFYSTDIFSVVYILLDKANADKIISNSEINARLRILLKLFGIEEQTAKKLFKR